MSHSKSLAVVLSIFLSFFSLSCNKNNVVSPNDISPQKQLSKIVQDANNYSAFYYSNGKLSKYESYANTQLNTSVTLNYAGEVKPQSENYIGIGGDLMKYYHYNSNSVLDSMIFSWKDSSGNYIPQGYKKYYYNGLGQLAKTEQFTNSNLLVAKFEYSYDSNGNEIEEKLFDSNQLVSDATMTYDNKVNPWYSLKDCLLYNVSINKNNELSRNQVYYNAQENYQTTASYVYDSDGYPINSETQYSSQSNNITITKTYEYK